MRGKSRRVRRTFWMTGIVAAVLSVATGTGLLFTWRMAISRTADFDTTEAEPKAVYETAMQPEELVVERNGGIPEFDVGSVSPVNRIDYGETDALGRPTGVTAVLSAEGMRKKTEKISPDVMPPGYHRIWYDSIVTGDGERGAYLWQRCHLLKSLLGGASDDERNFIAGTVALNYASGMAAYEKMVIDYLKHSGRKQIPTDSQFLIACSPSKPAAEEEVMGSSLRQELYDCCMKLKEPYRQVALDYFYYEMSTAEMAEKSGKNLKTVQTQIYRAKAMLRKLYRREDLLHG